MVRSGKVLVPYWYRMVLLPYRTGGPLPAPRAAADWSISDSRIWNNVYIEYPYYTSSSICYFTTGQMESLNTNYHPLKVRLQHAPIGPVCFFFFVSASFSLFHPAGSTQMGPFLTAGNRGCCQRPMIACLTVELSVELSSLSFLVS